MTDSDRRTNISGDPHFKFLEKQVNRDMTRYSSYIDDNEPDQRSRTQKKKQAAALQELGGKLSLLPLSDIEQLDLDPELFAALKDGKSITSKEAARRHRQFIGTLMRQVDHDSILEAMAQLKFAPKSLYNTAHEDSNETDAVHQAVFEQLLAGDNNCLESLLSANPQISRQHARQLIRNANKDMAQNKKASKAMDALKQIISSC